MTIIQITAMYYLIMLLYAIAGCIWLNASKQMFIDSAMGAFWIVSIVFFPLTLLLYIAMGWIS